MTDPLGPLLVDVRANTQGFAQDVAELRRSFDGTLVEGLAQAGPMLERGLLGALQRGSLGFEDLRRVALGVLDAIAGRALSTALGPVGKAGTSQPSLEGLLSGVIGAALGLPGRATGGPVAPGRGYLVGENGPELFVPGSAGRIEPGAGASLGASAAREVRVAIAIHPPAGTEAPQALQRSARQVAAAVRRALQSS